MSDRIQLTAEDGALAEIHLRGAHLTRWQPAGTRENRLFLSERAIYAEGVPIRGGVPVIFPQFAGAGPLPKHGFARTAPWHHETTSRMPDGSAQALFTLADTDDTRALWPHAFQLTLTVTVGGPTLDVRLKVRNTGSSPFAFTSALHSYPAVNDIDPVRVKGLQGLWYCDTTHGGAMRQEDDEQLRIAGEVDRNYFDTPKQLKLRDGNRELRIEQGGFSDTVVWNPGAASSANFKDLAPADYRRFLCVEAAVIRNPIRLAPGAEWRGWQRLSA